MQASRRSSRARAEHKKSRDLELPADRDHVLRGAARPRQKEFMPRSLTAQRNSDRGTQIFIGSASSDDVAQADGVVVAEARVQVAGRRQAHAVARVAKMFGHRGDDADLARWVG